MEQVRNVLNKGVDFDNLSQELISLTVQTSDNAQPITNISFKSSLRNKVKGLVVISANITSSNISSIQQAPFVSFSQENGLVYIRNITGLAANTKYELLLLSIS